MYDFILIGGGPYGSLAALHLNDAQPGLRIGLFEKKKQLLSSALASDHFLYRNTELDRDSLLNQLDSSDVQQFKSSAVTAIRQLKTLDGSGYVFEITTRRSTYIARKLVIACGKDTDFLCVLQGMGIAVSPVKPVAFKLIGNDPRLQVSGIHGLPVQLSWMKTGTPRTRIQIRLASEIPHIKPLRTIEGCVNLSSGKLFGPAVARLTAYITQNEDILPDRIKIRINWLPEYETGGLMEYLQLVARSEREKNVYRTRVFNLPPSLWNHLAAASHINRSMRWEELTEKQLHELAAQLTESDYYVRPDLRPGGILAYQGGIRKDMMHSVQPECRVYTGMYFIGSIIDHDNEIEWNSEKRPMDDLNWLGALVKTT